MKTLLAVACLLIVSCSPELDTKNKTPDDWVDWKQSAEAGYVSHEMAVLKAADYRYIPLGGQVFAVKTDIGYKLSLEGGDTANDDIQAVLSPGRLNITQADQSSVYTFDNLPTPALPLSASQRLRFNLENITHTEKRVRAILFDDSAKALDGFPGLSFFEYNPAGVISARFEIDPDMPEIILDTERGLTKAFYRAGFARFTLDAVEYKMPLYTGSNQSSKIKYFFTGFVDATTGADSYGTGRYVDISGFETYPPKELSIDFNYAYNPYCARSDAYNCPVIDFAIEAPMRYGESYSKE